MLAVFYNTKSSFATATFIFFDVTNRTVAEINFDYSNVPFGSTGNSIEEIYVCVCSRFLISGKQQQGDSGIAYLLRFNP